jgi:hypothetical protein
MKWTISRLCANPVDGGANRMATPPDRTGWGVSSHSSMRSITAWNVSESSRDVNGLALTYTVS